MRFVHDVKQTTRSGDKDVTALLKLSHLLTDWTSTVCNTWPQHGAAAGLASFVEDLTVEFAGESDNEDKWLATNAITLNIKTISQFGSRCR